MRTFRYASLVAIGLAVTACNESSAPLEPSPGRDAPVPPDLQAVLADWIRQTPRPTGPVAPLPPKREGGGPFTTVGTTMFLMGAVGFGDPAFAATPVNSSPGPCTTSDVGYYLWAKAFSLAEIATVDAVLLGGGSVQAELTTSHVHSGDGRGSYAELIRLIHWSFATGVETVIASVRANEATVEQVPNTHAVPVLLPVTSVAGWGDQDELRVEAFGATLSRDPDCGPGNTASITQWTAAAPVITQ